MESELPLEDLLKSLPKEMLEKPSSDLPFDDDSSDDSASSLVRFVFMLDLECDFLKQNCPHLLDKSTCRDRVKCNEIFSHHRYQTKIS